ncbi:thioredoxin family protein [Stenomitos frigidus]|nr:thioredoxin family protein [Stenomitos frigidus]
MEKMSTVIGNYAPDFEIPGIDGSVHHLARYLEQFRAVGVVFMCNHCPYVKLYLDRLKQIQTEFERQGVTLIGINSNDADRYPADSFDNMKRFATDNQLNFPYLRDVTQEVAQSFGAEKTPHLFLLNQNGVLCYSGSVDDSPNDPNSVRVTYLRDAIAQILLNAPIKPTSTEPIGCSVKWRS